MSLKYDPNLKPPTAGDVPLTFAVACGLLEGVPDKQLRAELRRFNITIYFDFDIDSLNKTNSSPWIAFKWKAVKRFKNPAPNHEIASGTMQHVCREVLKQLGIGKEVTTHDTE